MYLILIQKRWPACQIAHFVGLMILLPYVWPGPDGNPKGLDPPNGGGTIPLSPKTINIEYITEKNNQQLSFAVLKINILYNNKNNFAFSSARVNFGSSTQQFIKHCVPVYIILVLRRIKKVFYKQRHCLLLYMCLADLGQTAALLQR